MKENKAKLVVLYTMTSICGKGKFHTFIFFNLRPIRFSFKIDDRVLGISTFTGLIIGSVSFKCNINKHADE